MLIHRTTDLAMNELTRYTWPEVLFINVFIGTLALLN